MNIASLLKNKYVYYAAVVLMVINILGYVSLQSIHCVLIFGITAYVANRWTKNRTLDILAGLFVANVLFGCGRIKEGFREGAEQLEDAAAKLQQGAKEAGKQASCLCEGTETWQQCQQRCEKKAKASALASAAAQAAK